MSGDERDEAAPAVRAAVQNLGATVLNVERLPGLSGNPSWRVDTAAGPFAARLYPRAKPGIANGLVRANGLARLGATLRAATYPAPGAVGVGVAGEHVALVQEWMPGVPLLHELEERPERAGDLGLAFGAAHARLHALPVPDEARAALRLLNLPTSPHTPPAWLHLDYHPLNVLVAGSEVSAVLDWENVALGDARLDVARTLSILSADPAVWVLGGERRRSLLAFRRGYLAGYGAGGGRLEGMAPFLAWAGEFMRQDLAARFSDGELEHVARWERAFKRRA